MKIKQIKVYLTLSDLGFWLIQVWQVFILYFTSQSFELVHRTLEFLKFIKIKKASESPVVLSGIKSEEINRTLNINISYSLGDTIYKYNLE